MRIGKMAVTSRPRQLEEAAGLAFVPTNEPLPLRLQPAVVDRAGRSTFLGSLGRSGFLALDRLNGWSALFIVLRRRSLCGLRFVGTLARKVRALGEGGGDRRSLGAEPRRGKRGRFRAGTIGAAVATVAVVEATHELGAANGRRPLVLQDLLHLVAPKLAFLGPTQLTQIMDCAENLGEPDQLAVIGAVIGRRGRRAFPWHDRRQVVAGRLRPDPRSRAVAGRFRRPDPRSRRGLGVEPIEELGLGDWRKRHTRRGKPKHAEQKPQKAEGLSHTPEILVENHQAERIRWGGQARLIRGRLSQ